jgi:two-component system, chemotaxis family, sensor kinase CheA
VITSMWDQFVDSAGRDAASLAAATQLEPRLGYIAFRIGLSCLGIGAEPVGRLALAIERGLDRVATLDDAKRKILAQAIATLHDAFIQLANPDKSGARVEDLPLAERAAAIEAAIGTAPAAAPAFVAAPVSAAPSSTAPRTAPTAASATAPSAPPTSGDSRFAWTPTVEDDMVEMFFDEATERLEALSAKLVEIERRPDDADLLRDVFRDMHTVKGSSAMVGLKPVNDLAHAAEDLIGQVRDAGRAVDAMLVDAVLAALDALRAMVQQARTSRVVTVDPGPVIARLRNPAAAPAAIPTAVATARSAPVASQPTSSQALVEAARQTIRVDFDKLDRLMNLVGELVLGRDELRGAVGSLGAITSELASDRGMSRRVTQARTAGGSTVVRGLETLGDELSRVERVLSEVASELDTGTDRLDAISAELREQVMRLRMVPLSGVFRKHVRTVRDLAGSLGKRARLELEGDETELDKLLVEQLDEPLMHLVRNAVDHGLESSEGRVAAGKPEEGVVRLTAAHRGNQVEIRVSDDGRGLDPAKLKAKALERGLITEEEAEAMDDREARELIFRAGFSTAATVSDVSGRGVGMDVVRQTIIARLKGTIDVESTVGQGSTFVLKLPLTLAIIQVLTARAGGETFAIPLDVVQRVLAIRPDEVELVGDREVYVMRGKHVPLVRVDAVLELDSGSDAMLQLVVVEHNGHAFALVCDQLLGKREIVIKSLGKLLSAVPCVAGATLIGNRVALILDVPAIIERSLEAPAVVRKRAATKKGSGGHILLVEDSDIVRESLRRILTDAGYVVTVAIDGVHGLELAKTRRFDLISTDVMMPRMDGYELTRALRAMPEYADAPIVMVTSMGERIDRVRGFDAGVDEYITKPHDRTQLLRVVRKLLGSTGEPEGGES